MAEKKSWRDYSNTYSGDDSTKKSTDRKTGTWRDYASENSASIVANNVVGRVNTWLQNHNDYVSGYQSRYSGRKWNYEDAYVSDSADWLDTISKQHETYRQEAKDILAYMDQHKDYLDAGWVNQVRNALISGSQQQRNLVTGATKDNEWWNNWNNEELVKKYGSAEEAYKAAQREDGYSKTYTGKTADELSEILAGLDDGEEKDWLTSYRASVDYDEKSKYDLNSGAKEIEELTRAANDMAKYSTLYFNVTHYPGDFSQAEKDEITAKYNSLLSQYGTPEEIEATLREKKQYHTLAGRVQEGIKLSGVADSSSEFYDPEFTQYSGYVSGGKMPLIPDYKDIVYGLINGDQAAKEGRTMATGWSKLSDGEKSRLDAIQYMTEDEKALYNYYYNKQGYEAAEKYLDSIVDNLNAQHGSEMFKAMENKPVLELVFGLAAGLDQFNSGIKNLFNGDDYIPTSATQYASGLVREDMKDVDLKWYNFKEGEWDDAKIFGNSLGQTGYDMVTTTANMAPSILVSSLVGSLNPAAGAVVGNTLMGASAAGNAYQEVINQGYGKDEARFYSTAVGASEALLQYALGGIGKLGGVSSKLAKAVEGIDNGLLRFALQYGGKMASEGLEEGLQEILNPIFKNAILNTDEDINWSEAAYSALLGGLSAGLMEGRGTAINVATEQKFKKKYGDSTEDLIKEGLESDINSDSYKLATEYKAKLDAKKNLTGAEIRKLVEANEAQFKVEDYKETVPQAKTRFAELGETGNVEELAQLAAKRATGQELTRAEKSALVNSKFGAKVAKELKDEKEGKTATYKSLAERAGTESSFNVSKSGQAIIRETGETIDLRKAEVAELVKDKKGNVVNMVIKADGKEVEASQIDYADGDQSYLFEAVSKIENISPRAATAIVRDYDPSAGQTVGEYLNGIDEGFTYGYYGYSEADLRAGNFTPKLTDIQKKSAYELGRFVRESSDADADTPIVKMRTAAEAKMTAEQKERIESNDAEVYFQDGKSVVKFDAHTGKYDEKRMAAVNTAKFLSKLGIGGKYYFYESYVKDGARVYKDANGNEVEAPNGMFKESDGSIHIDLNAGDYGQGTALFTLGHELTHFIKDQSKKQFKVLGDLVTEAFDKTDMSMHERVLAKQRFLEEKRGEKVSYDKAHEEVVADAMSTMISDGSFYEMLMEIRVKDKGLFNTIKRFFEKLIAKFRKEYAELTPDQRDARDIREMKDMFDKIQKAFAESLVEASDNFQGTGTQKNTTNDGGVAMSIREVAGESGKNYGKGVYLDSNKLTNVPEDQRKATVIGAFRKLGGKKVIAYDQNGAAIEISIAEGSRRYKNTKGKSIPVNNHITSFLNNPVKQEALILADELIAVSRFEGQEKAVHAHDWLDNDGKNPWDVWKVFIQEKNNSVWEATLKVANTVDGEKVLYEIYPIEMVEAARKPGTSTTNNKVAQPAPKVNSQNSGSNSERGDSTSNRSLLANAFEGITQNSEEYKLIQEYKGRIKILNEYEEKLSKLNAEIREIRFTEGKYDAAKLRQLEAEAKNVAEAINRNDRKLLSLEASEPLRKVIERERKKEAQKTRDHVKEIQQNKKARAEQTELRHKIRKTVRDLDKLLNRGNKKANVKEDMKGFVSKALELADYLFTDHISNDDLIRKGITVRMTPREAALVKETEDILSQIYDNYGSLTAEEYARLDAKRKSNMDKLRDLLTSQRNERLNTPVYDLFNDLVTEYAALKNSKQESVKAAYDPNVERFLREYMGETNGETDSDRKSLLQNMRVADMTTKELQHLLYAYTMVMTSVRDANKLHIKGKTETIEQMAGRITGDFSKRKAPDGKVATVLRNLSNKIGWDYEKLYYALDRIGSEAFTELVMNIANSENIVMQDVIEAAAFRDEMVKNYGFNNWDVNKKIDREFLDNTGKKFKLTLGQMMALYAYSRREGAWDHIEYGGFVFGEAELTNPKPADSYKLSQAQCEAITNLLTKEQKGYVEAMQKFLSETMGAKGNEVSMQLYGIKMFTEKNYFPIHIAGQFKAQANESQAKAAAGFSSMTNAGFTHAQNPNAKAPFVLEGFNDVWADHVNEMSRYHGTVPALEDMRRVMNRSFYSESGMESIAIKQMMENSFGKEAVDYFDNLYREANSGAITDKLQKWPKKLLRLFRKNSVAYSLSVLVQQPASLVRAYAMIDKKYFGYNRRGLFKTTAALSAGVAKAVSNKWTKAHTNAYNEMLKYAPGVTMAKEIGGFDTATGGSIRSYLLDTNKSLKQKMKTETLAGKAGAVMDLVDNNAIANLPNVADKIAWIEIWNACKRETVAKHKDLATSSEEFMQLVGERFTEVIRATQVYDSIFAKSPMLKSKNLAVQYLVSFMNEPNTTANMVEKAMRDVTKGDWKSGARTAAVVVHSIIFTNVLKSIVYAMRDDDEDETYIEKYLESITGNLIGDFVALNYIPLARDAWSIWQGYDVERPDMAIVQDAISAVQAVIKNINKDTENMTEEQLIEFDKKVTESNWRLVESIASFFGIPVKNIRREIEGVFDHARIASTNAGMTTSKSAWDKVYDSVIDSIPFMPNKHTKTGKLYEAIIGGDKTYVERLKNTYKDDSAYQSAVRKALKENDPRIREAAQARYDGNTEEYKRIFREIQKESKFGFDDIMSAVNSEISAIRNKLELDKATSRYSAGDFVESIVLGDAKTAQAMRGEIIAAKIANGKTQEEAEKEFASDVVADIGKAYSSGLLDKEQAEKMLQEYAGKDAEEAASKVGYWAFCEAYPQYKDVLTEANVAKYHEFAEPAKISLEVYAQFINGTKGLKDIKDEWGDVEVTKREQVLEVIDSLSLTWQQKDALYLAARYAENKIWDVPW